MPGLEWRHIENDCLWAYGEFLEDYQEWLTYGTVSDEFISRVPADMAVKKVQLRFGSLPPPLQEKQDALQAAKPPPKPRRRRKDGK